MSRIQDGQFAEFLDGEPPPTPPLEQSDSCEACQRKDRYMAIVSHELRNMLVPVVTALDVCLLTNERDIEFLKMAAQNARQLARLIDDLMDACRLASGKVQIRPELVDVQKIVERSIQAVSPAIKALEQECLVTSCDSPLWLNADPLRLEQVFVNLLNNAVKFTPKGGCMWLQLRRENDSAVFQVRDSGCGISREHLPYIFDLFSQADNRNAFVSGGLGIGLTMVRSLIELHDGTVTVHSDGPGCGSDFTVRLPLRS